MTVWDAGAYELTADRLQPAADVVVAALGPSPGVRVLDIGCGTGNGALAAAHAGHAAHGVDSAPRLLAVARERARAAGVDVAFEEGDATALPYPDDAFDVAFSIFGVIFADPPAAAAELLRVTRGGGRVIVTTWLPGGVAGRVLDIVREALGAPPQPSRWSSEDYLRELFAGRELAVTEHAIAFTAASPEAYVQEQTDHHPLAQAAGRALREAGIEAEVNARILAETTAANEDPAAFLTTSRYLVVTVAA